MYQVPANSRRLFAFLILRSINSSQRRLANYVDQYTLYLFDFFLFWSVVVAVVVVVFTLSLSF